MDKFNPVKQLMALKAMNPEWCEDMMNRTQQAMDALLVVKVHGEKCGDGDAVGYGDIIKASLVLSNVLASLMVSIYKSDKSPLMAVNCLLAILDLVSENCRQHGLDVKKVIMSDVNDVVENLKKSAGF